jgi:hypothetical protein
MHQYCDYSHSLCLSLCQLLLVAVEGSRQYSEHRVDGINTDRIAAAVSDGDGSFHLISTL